MIERSKPEAVDLGSLDVPSLMNQIHNLVQDPEKVTIHTLGQTLPYWTELETRALTPEEQEQMNKLVRYPNEVIVRSAQDAFRKNRDRWEEKYEGQWIAIWDGKVLDSDFDRDKLYSRLDQKYAGSGIWGYTLNVGYPPPESDPNATYEVQSTELKFPKLPGSNVLRIGTDYQPPEWSTYDTGEIKPLNSKELPQLIQTLRHCMDRWDSSYPLTIGIDCLDTPASYAFLKTLRRSILPDDSCWIIGSKKDQLFSEENIVYTQNVDDADDNDMLLFRETGYDLLFISSPTEAKLKELLRAHEHGAVAIITDSRQPQILHEFPNVGASYFRYHWQESAGNA